MFQISCSSSLLDGYDEPEILRYENLKSVPLALTSDTAYTGAELAYFLTDAEPRLLVCDPARLAELQPIAASAGVAQVLTLAADESGSLA